MEQTSDGAGGDDDYDDGGLAHGHIGSPVLGGASPPPQPPALSWTVGERIEARDNVGMWFTARVSDIRVSVQEGRLREEVLVHFEGWPGR